MVVEDGVDAAAGAEDAKGLGVGGLVEVEVDARWVVGTWGLLEEIGYGSKSEIY